MGDILNMLTYYCKRCEIDCETSECSVCKEKEKKVSKIENRKVNPQNYRTETNSKIYWCNNCNIPIYEDICSLCGEEGKYITTDLRPVFPEERLLLEILTGEPFRFKNSSVWNGTGNRYIVDGKRINISLAELMKNDTDEVIKKLNKYSELNSYDYFYEYIWKFTEANKKRLNSITSESIGFIKDVSVGYSLDEMFVSFSGGKDSTVVHDLVIKALSKPEIIHIFGDTTLEFPLTMQYLQRFKHENRKTPVISAKNKDKNFRDMCELLGPPSRVMRWCCTVFKTGAITRKINGTFKNKKRLLTFYGIRRSESVSRNKYDRESESPKIVKQKVVSPIIDWYDFDIWLYLLTNKIDFNDAYRLGYSRVGCWCCPNNSSWAQFLSSIYMSQQYKQWRDFLVSFASRIGKPDPEVYVDEGNWKARQGGNGIELSKNVFVAFKPCAAEADSFSYELKRPITEELYEFFKPFGWISKGQGNERLGEIYVVDKNKNPIIRLQGRIGTNLLKVSILKIPLLKTKNLRESRLKIECQITKYQMCVGCLACESICKQDAIIIKENKYINCESAMTSQNSSRKYINTNKNCYKIDDKKCIRCGECINHFDGGCYMRKVLITRKEE